MHKPPDRKIGKYTYLFNLSELGNSIETVKNANFIHSKPSPRGGSQKEQVFVFQKGFAQSSGFDAQFLKIILWPCTKLEGAAKLKIAMNFIKKAGRF